MNKHIRLYIGVFIALAVFTVLTVAASLLQVSPGMHLTIALIIAIVKAALVAAIFMHLKWERNVVLWGVILVTAVLFVALFALPSLIVGEWPPGVEHTTWG